MDFSLNQAAYAELTLDQLEQRIIKWSASQKILSASDPSASASASAAKPFTPASTPNPAAASSSGTPTITTETITKAVKENKCVCSNHRHKLVNCIQFLKAGFIIVFDPEKAKERLASIEGKTKSAHLAGNHLRRWLLPPHQLLQSRPLRELLHKFL